VGRTLGEFDLRSTSGVNVLAVERGARFSQELIQPDLHTELHADDVLLVDLFGPKCTVDALRERYSLEALPLVGSYFADRSQEIGMAEVMVPAESDLIGKTVVESGFRTPNGATVIGLRRGATAIHGGLLEERLRLGDTLLVAGRWKDIERLQPRESGVILLNMPSERADVLPIAGKAPRAVVCLLIVVGLMVSGVVSNVQAALIGCLLMGVLGCMDLSTAYRSIGWKTLVLIVGMLPFSIALQRTGGVDLAADALMSVTCGAGPRMVLAALFAITAILGMFISNTATAVLVP